MYRIVYTKTAVKDIPKLKAAHLDSKAKALIDLIRTNPFQTPPGFEKLVGHGFLKKEGLFFDSKKRRLRI